MSTSTKGKYVIGCDLATCMSMVVEWKNGGVEIIASDKGNRTVPSVITIDIRNLSGAEAKPIDRFLRLRKDRKVSNYNKYYTEESELFSEYENTLRERTLRERTLDLLNAYTCVNKIHNVKFADLHPGYKQGVYTLHNLYMKELRPNKRGSINFAHANSVVKSMKPFEQSRLIKAPKFVPPPATVAT